MGGYAVAVCHYLVSRLINFLPRSWRVLESVGECPPAATAPPQSCCCRAASSSSAHEHRRQDTGQLLADRKICRRLTECPMFINLALFMVKITNARQAESVQSLWHCLICRRMWKFLQLKSGCFVDSHHIFTLPACQLSEWVELSSPPLPASPRLLSSAPWPRSRLLAGLVSSSPRVGRHLAMMNAMLGTRRVSDVSQCSEWRVQYSETACTTTLFK